MEELIPFLVTGTLFGLTAGISPGPLLTLVITETLRHNRREGIKVALVPILTDAPILLVTLFIFAEVANFEPILGAIAILGSIFIAYLSYESISTKGLKLDLQHSKPQSMKKGIIVNFLSPHPYIFWMTVGAPITIRGYQTSLSAAIAFVLSFYVLLTGSKIVAALIVDKSRNFLQNKIYIWAMRLLGLALLLFAIHFFRDGLRLLNIIQ